MKISMSAHIVAVLIAGGAMFAFTRKGDENPVHTFTIPPIELHAYGGHGSSDEKKMLSCMYLKGCRMDEVIRVLNKYKIGAKKSNTVSKPDCIDIPGDHPFYGMTISRGGVVSIKLNPESDISQQTLEKIATEIWWAH